MSPIPRPQNEKELQKREAVGIIRASRFVREYARSRDPITIEVIRVIHRNIFKDAWPEIAGQWRQENLEITDSEHRPPAWQQVSELMHQVDVEFREKVGQLHPILGIVLEGRELTDSEIAQLEAVIKTAAWVHHKITFIHPFREGNGRTSRLAANLILERFGLVGISVKVERENKNRYLSALRQIDRVQDDGPLSEIISDGLIERYEGADLKLQ